MEYTIIHKFAAVCILMVIFGGVFMFDSAADGGSDGTFNQLLEVSNEHADQGNVTGWMGIATSLFPIFFVIMFIGLIGYAIFR